METERIIIPCFSTAKTVAWSLADLSGRKIKELRKITGLVGPCPCVTPENSCFPVDLPLLLPRLPRPPQNPRIYSKITLIVTAFFRGDFLSMKIPSRGKKDQIFYPICRPIPSQKTLNFFPATISAPLWSGKTIFHPTWRPRSVQEKLESKFHQSTCKICRRNPGDGAQIPAPRTPPFQQSTPPKRPR